MPRLIITSMVVMMQTVAACAACHWMLRNLTRNCVLLLSLETKTAACAACHWMLRNLTRNCVLLLSLETKTTGTDTCTDIGMGTDRLQHHSVC